MNNNTPNNCCNESLNSNIGFLFDLDGVLIDSEKEYTKIWAEIDRQFPSGVKDLPTRIKGMTLTEIIDTYFGEPHKRTAVPKLLYELEGKMKYEWLPGARELLLWLKEHNIPSVLVTSSNEVKMRHLREEQPELESFFTAIVTGDKVTKSKPDPEGYRLGAKLIERDPLNCVVFEDSLQGVKAGRAAGAFVVGVEGTLPSSSIQPFSDAVIKSLSEIDKEKLIKTLSSRSL
ncbi:MAG: HAD family phosphatase [Muribaculaceae bacterium]|nr:HAD family phosphatase [Muribaculaceae bacterium]